MLILRQSFGAVVALGLCSLTVSANADVFQSPYPVTERHSTQGGGTPGSFAAAAVMGAQGYNNYAPPIDWENRLISECTRQTGGSLWPAQCNPVGMASALRSIATASWVTQMWPETDQVNALNTTVASLKNYRSPAVVPIYGQADHWVTITQITATYSGSSWVINQVRAYDGGPPDGVDSSFNSYYSGLQSWGGLVWSNVYYKVLTAINPTCDLVGCGSDPYYKKYVLMYEPPPGQPIPPMSAVFTKAPGMVPAGQHAMNEHLARIQVWRALAAAGIDADLEIWNAISGGTPGTAFKVNAVFPGGAPWDYYLVPILSSWNTAIAFVQLSADDGSFESINVLTSPIQLNPVTMTRAEQLARGALAAGESLTGGILTWDPRVNSQLAKSPNNPYYEFGVAGIASTAASVIRVSLNNGTVVRGQ